MTTSHLHNIRRHYKKLVFLCAVAVALLSAGCNNFSSEAPPPPKSVTSANMGLASLHESGICTTSACEGSNCQTAGCHSPGDPQHGPFTVSGTVYLQDLLTAYSSSNAVIEFYSAPGGGDANRIYSLPVDQYGNYYTTENIVTSGSGLYPALYDKDNNRRVFMPRPMVPTRPASCNYCHSLSDATLAGTTPQFPDLSADPVVYPAYMRINNGIISSAGASTAYHSSFTTDPGPHCMQSGCHSDTGTVFSVAGNLTDSDTGSSYTLADAAIGLFAQPCLNPPSCTQTITNADGLVVTVTDRPNVPKMFLEVDDKGNFYTTTPIDWSSDTYPTLANYDANTACRNREHMLSAITGISPPGDCYSCHDGATQAAISIHGTLDAVESCSQ